MASISGIYEIVNKVNGHRYIGQSIDIQKRWRTHKYELRRGKHHSQHLQNAWNKYGADGFEFNVISYCLPFRIVMDALEQHYMDTLKPEYNISPTAGGSCLGVVRSQETKDKVSAANKGRKFTPEQYERHLAAQKLYKHDGFLGGKHTQEALGKIKSAMTDERKRTLSEQRKGKPMLQATKDKLSAARMGKKMSDESKAKLSAANKGKPMSEETKKKLSLAHKGKSRPPMTQETKDKLSISHIGKKMTDSAKAKLSAARKGIVLSESHKEKLRVAHTGKPLSSETIQKIKDAWARRKEQR